MIFFLRRDIEQYQNLTFDYQIIDEAQFIKNATTKPPRQLSRLTPGSVWH